MSNVEPAAPLGALGATIPRLRHETGRLARAGFDRMRQRIGWFDQLDPDDRSQILSVTQEGIAGFITWLKDPTIKAAVLSEQIFAHARPELVRSLSLTQTLELVRVAILVIEEEVPGLAAPGEEAALHTAVLQFSREVAFAAAEAYVLAAEERGSWDTRLQATLLDTLLSLDALPRGDREDAIERSKRMAAALAWSGAAPIVVATGFAPPGSRDAVLDDVASARRQLQVELLASVHGGRLTMLISGAPAPFDVVHKLAATFGAGPIVVGDAATEMTEAWTSARSAEAGMRAVSGRRSAARPIRSADLLVERVLSRDPTARVQLVARLDSLRDQPHLLDTLATFLETGNSVTATARALFMHENTVRHRLGRITVATQLDPRIPADAFALHVALTLDRLNSLDRLSTPALPPPAGV